MGDTHISWFERVCVCVTTGYMIEAGGGVADGGGGLN